MPGFPISLLGPSFDNDLVECQLQIAELSKLPPGWGGVGSQIIDRLCITRTIRLVRVLSERGVPLPTEVAPLSDGRLVLYWRLGDSSFGYDISKGDDPSWEDDQVIDLLCRWWTYLMEPFGL